MGSPCCCGLVDGNVGVRPPYKRSNAAVPNLLAALEAEI